MAHVFLPRTLETSSTAGAGPLTLAGAVPGFLPFSAGMANGDTVHYHAEEVDSLGKPTGAWEIGRGTWGTGGILTRTTVIASSNAGAAVVFANALRVAGTILPPGIHALVLADWQSLLLGATTPLGSKSANYLQVAGAAATLAPSLAALGSDANVDLLLTAKGTGNVAATSRMRTAPIAGAMAAASDATASLEVRNNGGTGDTNMAMVLFATQAINGAASAVSCKLGLRNDGYMGIGGGTTGTWRWYLDPTGNMVCAGNVTGYSDERFKTNWRPVGQSFVPQLATLLAGIYDRTDVELTQVGVSAQSLREILPEAVFEDADGTLSVAYGNAALVACVELAKTVQALTARIEALENRP